MPENLYYQIESWFREHDDGEFCCPGRSVAYQVIAPPADASRIIYATKSALATGFEDSRVARQSGLVCRRGLPDAVDVPWLRDFVGSRELLFLGDLDPPDLLIFAWLRMRLAPVTVKHYGLNDRLLAALRVPIPEHWQIALSLNEQQALQLLAEVLPDLETIVGPRCAKVLEQGRKLEVEAAISAQKSVVDVLLPALNF